MPKKKKQRVQKKEENSAKKERELKRKNIRIALRILFHCAYVYYSFQLAWASSRIVFGPTTVTSTVDFYSALLIWFQLLLFHATKYFLSKLHLLLIRTISPLATTSLAPDKDFMNQPPIVPTAVYGRNSCKSVVRRLRVCDSTSTT